MLVELNDMFKSDTIKPTFEYVHIVLALYIFDENPAGIGRYRIKEELLIGSGTAKSLIEKLNKKIKFISVLDENIRKGHVLTKKGRRFLENFKKKIPILIEGDISILKEIIIESENSSVYICQVKSSAKKLTNGIGQRDAAIKIDGKGASCIIFNGKEFTFELDKSLDENKDQMIVNEDVQNYFKKLISNSNSNIEKNDVIILGLGKNAKLARLAALNAGLTLI